MSPRFYAASRFALKHLAVSALIALGCAALVFGLWYRYPYNALSGGRELFLIVVSVDLVIGPLLSLVAYNPLKQKRELARDIGIIIVLQLAALAYGLYSVSQARPVFLAFEGDRFRVVDVPDVNPDDLDKAPENMQRFSLTGPRLIGVRLLDSSDPQYLKSLQMAMEGVHAAFRPERWVEFDTQRSTVIKEARPLEELKRKWPDKVSLIDKAVRREGLNDEDLGYLPLLSQHHTDWVVLVQKTDGTPRLYLPVDGWQ